MSFIKLIPLNKINNAANQLTSATVVALQRAGKVATGKTAQSIRTDVIETQEGYDLVQYGGDWVKYIIEGKPANTKLPVVKKGDQWELVEPLKNWAAVKGVTIPPFVLARSIAKNPRDPFDLPSQALEVYEQQFKDNFIQAILIDTTQNVGQFIKKENDRA